jgi:hypothetical protein
MQNTKYKMKAKRRLGRMRVLVIIRSHSLLTKVAIVLRQKFLYFDCHSGLDPESSIFELDSRFRGNDGFGTNVKKR